MSRAPSALPRPRRRTRFLRTLTALAAVSTAILLLAVPATAQHVTPQELLSRPPIAPDRVVSYGADSLQFGHLRIPDGRGPHPVVVLVHGGCWLSFADLRTMDELAETLTEAGYATWSLEYRRVDSPGGGWPGTFLDVGEGLDRLRTLAEEHPLDLERVVVLGHSSGGHLASWAAARHRIPPSSALHSEDPLPVAGVVNLDGPDDLEAFRSEDERVCGGPVIDRLVGGTPEEVPERYAAASPARMLPLGVPQRLFRGEDGQMSREAQAAYVERAREAGDDVESETIPDAGHFELVAPWAEGWSEIWPLIRGAVGDLASARDRPPDRPQESEPERLVYSSYRPAGWDIYLLGEEGSDPRRLTEQPALDYDATFSPDGRWVVFTSERNGSPDLFVLDLEGDAPPRLLVRSSAMEDQADVSPDGRWLAFVSTVGGDADVYRLPFRPGETLSMQDATNLTSHPGGDFRPAFSPDGSRIAFSTDRDTPPASHPQFPFALRRAGEIYVMDADGGAPSRLTRSPGWDGSPVWSSDGEEIFFYSERETRGEFRIWSVGVEEGEPHAVSPRGRLALSPAVTAGDRVAFTTRASAGGGARWRIASSAAGDRADSTLRVESDPSIDCMVPDVHPRTGWVVCHGGPPPKGASLADWPGPLLVAGSPRAREVGDRRVELYGIRKAFAAPPSPRSDEIVMRTGSTRLTLAAADGSGPSDLLDLADSEAVPPDAQILQLRWSGDGQWILFTLGPFAGGPDAESDIWRVRPDGSGLSNLTPDSPGNDGLGSVSGEDDRILFRSGRSGQYDLYVMDLDGDGVRRVTRSPAKETFPALAPGGDRIAFASDRDSEARSDLGFSTLDLYTAPLAEDGSLGQVRRISDDPAQEAHVEFSPDGGWLVYTSGRGGINDEEPVVQSVLFNPQSYGEIYAYRLSDGTTVRLTHNKWEDGAPVWEEAAARPATPPVAEVLEEVLEGQGIEAAVARYWELERTRPHAYRFGEGGLRYLGRRLLAQERPEIARRAFETLARVRPDDPRALTGVAAAALASADTAEAVGAYRRALEARPGNVSAEIALFELGASGYRPARLSEERLDRLTGRYALGSNPALEVEVSRTDGGRLSVSMPGFTTTVTPVAPLTFFDGQAKFVFAEDEEGNVTALRIHPEEQAAQVLEKKR